MISNLAAWFAILLLAFMAVATVVILTINLTKKEPKPMATENSRLVLVLFLIGVFSFLSGLALAVFHGHGNSNSGLALIVFGFITTLISVLLNAKNAKSVRAAWPVIAARCTGRQLEMKPYWAEGGSIDGWSWEVECEIDYGGRRYTVHPKIQWSDTTQADRPFRNEELAKRFISERISSNGECHLRINPANPLDAELIAK